MLQCLNCRQARLSQARRLPAKRCKSGLPGNGSRATAAHIEPARNDESNARVAWRPWLLRRRCRRPMASAVTSRERKAMAKDGESNMGINTRLAHSATIRTTISASSIRPSCMPRPCSFPRRGDDGGAQPEIHLRHARHADHRRACPRHRRAGRLGRHDRGAVGPCGGDRAAAGLPVGGRPCPDRRFGLSPDPQFRRHDAEAAGRRGRVLRSACRRRHRGADQAQHQGGVHRIARLQHVRGAGHTGHRQGGARRRRHRHDGQHLGDAALFPPARPRRRHLDPCGDEISGRPFRRAARHGVGQ